MNENPDNANYLGLGPQSVEPETMLDSRYLIPTQGVLRFIKRSVPMPESTDGMMTTRRILQQYQWSAEEGAFDWYDVPLVDE